jgi:hypothetical protein
MNLLKKINSPYPHLLDEWQTAVYTSLFIALFIVIFQPFGLQKTQLEYKEIIFAGYGLVTFVVTLLTSWLRSFLFPRFFREDTWTIKKELLSSGMTILNIGIANYLYSVAFSISSWNGFPGFYLYVLYTFLIGLIPMTLMNFISENHYLKKNLEASGDINRQIAQKQEKTPHENQEIPFMSGKQTCCIPSEDLIYIESMGNYLNVWYLKNKSVTSLMLRIPLKNIESAIENTALFKCHRAFIVNLSFVEKVRGNSQGYSLVMKNIEKEIPVARGYTKAFKESMMTPG